MLTRNDAGSIQLNEILCEAPKISRPNEIAKLVKAPITNPTKMAGLPTCRKKPQQKTALPRAPQTGESPVCGALGSAVFCWGFFRHVGSPAILVGFVMGALTSFAISFGREIFGASQSISFNWILPASFLVSMTAAYIAGFFLPRP